ncbi:unnamed protein product [Callosobruchus maculatus]|uniref:Telomeric repeat-binding factor 2-interacting protein 1 n=1 Tax=Callosobruchus maculatus TaxID=64391 RepID=A0A653CK52_CALMS|nr:unnamed protein product [Callosobruchus maculatus]
MVTLGAVGGGSRPYTIDEDDRIIQLIFMTRTGNSLRGNSVWQDFANTNRFPGRSWQSLKERFIKYIVPKLLQDGYRTPLWVRKLILIAWNQSAQSFRPAHITKNWEELYQLAEESGITFESEDEDSIVVVSNHCKQIYEELVREKTHRYIIFYIKDEYEIDVEFVGARSEDYDEFLTDLQIAGANKCRYGSTTWSIPRIVQVHRPTHITYEKCS